MSDGGCNLQRNEVRGYCLGRHGHNFTHIGPVIAKNFAVAKDLVSAALNNNTGNPIILDVLHFDSEWMKWLITQGFKEQRPLIRMYRGSNRFPGVPEKTICYFRSGVWIRTTGSLNLVFHKIV